MQQSSYTNIQQQQNNNLSQSISTNNNNAIMNPLSSADKQLEKKYTKLQIIGHGTFGSVYFARSNIDQPPFQVAIKHVHQNKKYKNRQIQILQIIKHHNIVQLYEFYYEQKNNNTYLNLIMQYLPHTLSSVIKDHVYCKTFIDTKLIIKYAYGLITALVYLRSIGIAHRDIKPSNILLNQLQQAKLCDFGSAKQLISNQKNISYICSRYYRSPQLILGAVQYSTQIDMWSLGCCIGEMIMNRPMFQGENNNAMMLRIIKVIGVPDLEEMEAMKVMKKDIKKIQFIGVKDRILRVNKQADLGIIQLIEKMLVYNPNKRIKPEDALKLKVFQQLNNINQNKMHKNKLQISEQGLQKQDINISMQNQNLNNNSNHLHELMNKPMK